MTMIGTVASREFRRKLYGKSDGELCFTDWVRRVADGDQDGLRHFYGTEKAALNSSSGTTGGYLVPTDFSTALLAFVGEQAIFRRLAKVQPMSSMTTVLPVPDITTARAADTPPWFGGVQMRWRVEGADVQETGLEFRQLELRAGELGGYLPVANFVLEDSGISAWLMQLFAEAVAWFEDYSFFQGDGVGKPLGVLNAAATIAVNRASANDFKQVDVGKMLAKLLPSSFVRAVWVVHPTVVEKLVQMGGFVTNEAPEIFGDAMLGVLATRPVLVSDKLPTLGTRGDVVLMDPQHYVIGDRGQLAIEVSNDVPVYFQRNQRVFRVTERLDGQTILDRPVTLPDGVTTASPFVVLN